MASTDENEQLVQEIVGNVLSESTNDPAQQEMHEHQSVEKVGAEQQQMDNGSVNTDHDHHKDGVGLQQQQTKDDDDHNGTMEGVGENGAADEKNGESNEEEHNDGVGLQQQMADEHNGTMEGVGENGAAEVKNGESNGEEEGTQQQPTDDGEAEAEQGHHQQLVDKLEQMVINAAETAEVENVGTEECQESATADKCNITTDLEADGQEEEETQQNGDEVRQTADEVVSPTALEPKLADTPPPVSTTIVCPGGGGVSQQQTEHQLDQHHQQADLFAAKVVGPSQQQQQNSDSAGDDTDASSDPTKIGGTSAHGSAGKAHDGTGATGGAKPTEPKAKTKLCSIL